MGCGGNPPHKKRENKNIKRKKRKRRKQMQEYVFDHERITRIGLPESVFCEGKSDELVQELLTRFSSNSEKAVLFTRLKPEIFARMPEPVRTGVDYDALSCTAFSYTLPKRKGRVAIVSAGNADGSVSHEVARTLQYLGIENSLFEDVGVAGLWRLTDRLVEINTHDVIIIVAGMDAALATVLAAHTARPIFAVPTSTGYGVSQKGMAALHSMLLSCASGLAVLNIDNGYGAACAAARVLA